MAIKNNDIRKLLNQVANKSREGLISYPKFNVMLQAETYNFFDYHRSLYDRDFISRRKLRPLVREETDLSSSGSIPYGVITSSIAKVIEARSDQGHHIEEIENEGIWYDRLDSYIKRPTEKHAIMRLKNNSLDLRPLTVTLQDIIYLKYPKEPYLDGLINETTLEFTALNEEETVDLDTTYDGYRSVDGQTEGSYTSKTVELGFKDECKLEIAARMLASLGLTYSKESLFQYMRLTNEQPSKQ